MNISGSVARVTGANRGLGLAFSRELVRRGLDAYSLDAYRVGEGAAWRRLIADATSQLSNRVQQERRLTPAGRPLSSALSSSRSHDRQDPWPVRQANQRRRMNRLSAAGHSRDRSEWERRPGYHLC